MAPVLGATSDGRATADSARGLMITLLGEFVLPLGGSAWTQTLLGAMEMLGVQPKTSRQVIARLADGGWLDRTKVGRRTRWHLTEYASALLRDGAERIYGFGHDRPGWDGRWLVLLASLPERDQHQRYRMTTGLTWAGFGSLGHGLWICPRIEQESTAVALLDDLAIDGATSFVAEVGALGDGADLARRAWDLDEVQRCYTEFLATIPHSSHDVRSLDVSGGDDAARHDASRADGSVEVVALALLVHRWRRFPFLDPGLPAELLPASWPGHLAVERFSEQRASLVDRARRWWSATDEQVGPAPHTTAAG